MENYKEILLQAFESASREEDMLPSSIPGLDLYMDQVITLFSENGRNLTKAMINNYSKDRVLTPIKGKKYSREHILRILMIDLLKQNLSISEIRQTLSGLKLSKEASEGELVELYAAYLEKKRESIGPYKAFLEGLSEPFADKNELLPLILTLSWFSATTKRLCEELASEFAGDEAVVKQK